jgi:hypothetical protein
MFFSKLCLFSLLSLISASVAADGYVIGFGAEGDSASGRAITAFGDFGLSEKTWLSAAAGSARTEGFIRDNDTIYADAGIDHWFKPVGIRLGASYWGNADILDARDLHASIYLRGGSGSISLEYEKRDFEFDLQSDLLRGRTALFSANGLGLTARLALGERVNFRLGGMAYDYSRNLRLQEDINVLAFVSSSRLSMVNSLIDNRFNAGLEYSFGLKSIDVTAGRWQTAIDGSTVDSYSVGFLTPVSDRLDMELRVAFDHSETFGRTTALSVHLYYFGGS